jgi:protein-disulfide isomerase
MPKSYSYALFLVGVVSLAGLSLLFFSSFKSPDSSVNNTKSPEKNDFAELIIGDPNAGITIFEYSDFKCPQCGKHHQDVGRRIREEFIETGKAKIVFRPFPVYAQDGAKALKGSYCAQDQAKFVEYHDALFDYMWVNHFEKGDYQKAIDTVLTDDVFDGILDSVKIEKSSFYTCLADVNTNNAYLKDIELAAPDGIQGTPTFIIGGQKIIGPQNYNVFKTLLEIQ